MSFLKAYRTNDSSKKITTYIFKNSSKYVALDFGSNDIPLFDVRRLNYIFITHEHSDHFMGLYNIEYAQELLESKCEIYASNVTKDLIIAIFENSLRVNFDERSTKKIRELLKRIKGCLFFEKYQLENKLYFKLFPSGHTYGSSMIYLNGEEFKILYTGDIDYDANDSDRQYQLELSENENVDYLIVDGTYLHSNSFKDEALNDIRDRIITRKYNKFLCKPEKIVFFAKKLISLPSLNKKYCIVFSSEMKWYLKILQEHNFDPFITDQIVLESSIYELPEKRIPLFVSSKKIDKQTNVTGLVGLHINFHELSYLIQRFNPNETKILVGHYNEGNEDNIIKTFSKSPLTCDYKVFVLTDEEYAL